MAQASFDVIVRKVGETMVDVEYDGSVFGLPFSLIDTEVDLIDMVGNEVTIEIPEWLARDRGMV